MFPSASDVREWIQHLLTAEGLTALATIALAAFGLIQLVLLWVQTRTARKERRSRLSASYAAVSVEYWKIQTTADIWSKRNLARLAFRGLLNAEDIFPFDPPGVARLLGDLGMQAARFGGLALSEAQVTREHIALLDEHARLFRRRIGKTADVATRQALLMRYELEAEPLVQDIRRSAETTSRTFEDALRSSPAWLQRESYDLTELKSPAAQGLRAHYGGMQHINRLSVLAWNIRAWANNVWERTRHWFSRLRKLPSDRA
jgi:hypothetical protein